jgi:nucleoside-diphosphate-sugar epimerase
MKKLLVTGATGFIGNHLVPLLLDKGFEVVATSLSKEKAAACNWFDKVHYIPFNLEDFEETTNYFSFFGQPDLMIHLAWEGLPNYKADFHVEVNLPGHAAFLKNLIVNGLRDLTVTGTCFEYGFREGKLDESMVAQPANAYAMAKDSLRKYLEELQSVHPFSFKWVRLFYMYGSGQNPNAIFSQLDRAIHNGDEVFNMSGGEQVRDYLPVEKVAEYMAAIAAQSKVSGIINCCSGKPVKLKDLVQQYADAKGAKIHFNLGYYPYADYEPMEFWGDNNKLKQIISLDQQL